MKLGDLLADELKEKLLSNNIEIGNVYTVPMNEQAGITPKDGELFRTKFFIVLGIDQEGNIYGGTVINSVVNQNISLLKQAYHLPISQSKYTFLSYDSFVNCAELKVLTIDDMLKGRFAGVIDDYDLHLITERVIASPYIPKGLLRQFNIQ